MKFRGLKADEIEVRVGNVSKTGATFLLYKDARCDMQLLDETVGSLNWKREHTRDNANCIVSIYDTDKKEWVSKEDTGTESNTEKEKGLASDSFKRACFNWGLGRELYTAPLIFVALETQPKQGGRGYELTSNGKKQSYLKVKEIDYIEEESSRKISKLIITDSKGNEVFKYDLKKVPVNVEKAKADVLARTEWRNKVLTLGTNLGYKGSEMAKTFGLTKDTTVDEFKKVYAKLEEEKNAKHTTE